MRNLKYLREQKGFSQTELANLLSISKNTILNWEMGKAEPPFSIISKMAQHLGFSLDDFAFKDMEAEGLSFEAAKKEGLNASEQTNYLVKVADFPTYCTANDARFLQKAVIPGINGKARTFEVASDNMVPLLMYGDWAVCLPVGNVKELDDGRIFVVITNSSEVVFGYAQSFREGVKVRPHNLAGYTWQMIPYEQVFEVWQVRMRVTKYFMLPYVIGEVGGSQMNEPGEQRKA